jgi:ankyrin repeat protein
VFDAHLPSCASSPLASSDIEMLIFLPSFMIGSPFASFRKPFMGMTVELGADLHARNPFYDSPPLGAANYKRHRHVVEYLLQFAPIYDAVKYGGLDRVRALLRENPECVRVRDKDGRTPLHYPYRDTQHGAQIIELLIAHGADTSAEDNEGRTPADQMLQNGRRDLAEVLRRHGGDSA